MRFARFLCEFSSLEILPYRTIICCFHQQLLKSLSNISTSEPVISSLACKQSVIVVCVKYNIPKNIFITRDVRFLPHHVQNHHRATKCSSIQCINSKHHGLFVNIPGVINVNNCFECHPIQFIHCVCLNNFHELWCMAGSHIFAFAMKFFLKTLIALSRYITV